ncbi:PQQ-binding-like beta-propeller repeat protein [Terriglobus roseus]|uniref:Quinoprotein glucose dehydrogenase n=1 Tax=Terriglobus roseus TaxID=392734 RepID=A0A1G7KRQ1_9BACT|nr:PQQ-binding-like beta-propeller repeat protein [Terriglobus roseus]SDF39640.1 quinoprotein glucose dehydrogenase [Terriglobus roseus]
MLAIAAGIPAQQPGTTKDWGAYQGGPDSIHYSRLTQIDRTNVQTLKVAWTFDTGEVSKSKREFESNPLIIHGVLYGLSPSVKVFALDAATGKQLWTFDPAAGTKEIGSTRNRGVTYWSDASGKDSRIFVTFRQYLYAIEAKTGKLVESFGDKGRVDLRIGLRHEGEGLFVTMSTPGVIYKDMLICGSMIAEQLPAFPGDIRAFDVRTGKIRWQFHTIPHPGEFGYETWPKDAWRYSGAANDWAGLSLDRKRGIAYVPLGSAAPDFYGGDRVGNNLFANSLVALDANTGKRIWHYQFVHHDIWDRDLNAPPALVTIKRNGKVIDAVAQTTKTGHVFVFDRVTGKPLFPIEEKPYPSSTIPGEITSPTQPLPIAPPAFARQTMTERDITNRTPEAHAAVLRQFQSVVSNGQFTPQTLQGTVLFPGSDGGQEWGGPSFDPETGLLYTNANEMAWIVKIAKRPPPSASNSGKSLYTANCSGCHNANLSGNPPDVPALTRLDQRLTNREVVTLIRGGNGRMPAFPQLNALEMNAIAEYVLKGNDNIVSATSSASQQRYMLGSSTRFLDPDGYPAITPPWGTLTAIDLNKGTFAWQIPLGEYPELAAKGLKNTGSENYGGGVVTAGGLLFIGATNYDKKFRAFDKATGKLLWETTLPFAGNATPAIYEVNGKEYVVIAAGGGKSVHDISGGEYVAFALP